MGQVRLSKRISPVFIQVSKGSAKFWVLFTFSHLAQGTKADLRVNRAKDVLDCGNGVQCGEFVKKEHLTKVWCMVEMEAAPE